MKFILPVTIFLMAGVALGQATTGMPMNPANSQPGTSMPLNNGTTVPVPANGGGINTIPPLQAPVGNGTTNSTTATPAPGPSAYP